MKSSAPNNHSFSRRGAIAVIALITILITISIGLGLVRTALLEREAALRWQQQKQSVWLVEAGIERAIAQRQRSPEYQGETWLLTAEELGGSTDAEVTIELVSAEDAEDQLQLTVVADYPARSDRRIRSRKVIFVAKTPSDSTDEP